MHERVGEEVRQVRLGEKEGGFRPGDCKEIIDWLVLGYAAKDLKNVEGRAREADRLCGDQRDQDDGADGSRSPPAEPVGPYPSVNRGTSGRDCFGK